MSTAIESTVEDARARAERIRSGLDNLANLRADIVDAYQAQDWTALGYDSWSSYVEAEFVGARLRLPRDERRELVGSLREAGMSTRAIAATTGVDRKTAMSDVRHVVQNGPPEPTPVTGLDGKTYAPPEPADQPEPGEDEADEPIEAELVDEPASAIPQPAAPTRRRRPITDAAQESARDGRKWADKLARVLDDDRYPKHAEQIARMTRADLLHVRNVVADALDRLDNDTE